MEKASMKTRRFIQVFLTIFFVSALWSIAEGGPHDGISLATPAAQCGTCHQKEFNEWRYGAGSDLDSMGKGSRHSLSFTGAMYEPLLSTCDNKTQAFCNGCHVPANPWQVQDQDKINNIPSVRYVNTAEGVNCVVCHYDGNRKVTREELKNPLFCATCHADHNDGYNLTDAYITWMNDYKGGKKCVDCHMSKSAGGHSFSGSHSPNMESSTLKISSPNLPNPVVAGVPFNIDFNIQNIGAGHSFPVCPLRKLTVKVSILDGSNKEVSTFEKVYHKRSHVFKEDESLTEVVRAGEAKLLSIPRIINSPGIYSVKISVFRDSNRLGIMNSMSYLGGAYNTFVVEAEGPKNYGHLDNEGLFLQTR